MPTDLKEHEVLVKIHAASLNYRDLAIAKVSGIPGHQRCSIDKILRAHEVSKSPRRSSPVLTEQE